MADAVEEEIRAQKQGGSVAKDLFAGAVGGIAQVLIGKTSHRMSKCSCLRLFDELMCCDWQT